MEQEDEFQEAEAEAEAEEGGVRKRKRLIGGGEGEEGGFGCAYDKELLLGDTEGAAADEEAVAEVMRWLEAEISPPPPPEQQQEDLGFVTINGNEESCGPSFSAAASTVMASVDTRAGAPPPPPVPWPWPQPQPLPHHLSVDVGKGGGEGEGEADEDEEEWLARLLNCGPAAALELEVEPEGGLLA